MQASKNVATQAQPIINSDTQTGPVSARGPRADHVTSAAPAVVSDVTMMSSQVRADYSDKEVLVNGHHLE